MTFTLASVSRNPPSRRVNTETEATPPPLDPLLTVVNPAVIKPKGRPRHVKMEEAKGGEKKNSELTRELQEQ